MTRPLPVLLSFASFALAACAPSALPGPASCDPAPPASLSHIRSALERQNERNRAAFMAENLDSIMVLRTAGFTAVGPDGRVRSRSEMEDYTRGLLNGISRWIELTVTIDSLALEEGEARATVSQHLDRMALRPDGKVHHVETWVRQRESWICTEGSWKLHRVDNVRDQRRLVDGEPG